MPVPDYESLILPLLRLSGDGQVRKASDACTHFCQQYGTTKDDPHLVGRFGTAKDLLIKAKLLESPAKAAFQITPRRQELLKSPPVKITRQFLRYYPERVPVPQKTTKQGAVAPPSPAPKSVASPPPVAPLTETTPEVWLEQAYNKMRKCLADDLRIQIKQASPRFIEQLAVDLLVVMGYGGSFKNAAQVVGGSGDAGIDGIIKEDPLGFDVVYLQAKKREGVAQVGLTDIQKFVGALQGNQAAKGVFLTTGTFTEEAKAFVKTLLCKIILIDGERLINYLIDFNVGVSVRQAYEVKKIDTDYFAEE